MPGDRRTWAGAFRTADDVRKVLDDINQQGLTRGNTTALARAVQQADDVELGPDPTKLLPADDWLTNLLPWPGLPRGATIGMVGSTTLLLTLIAGALRDGGYAAVVGLPHLGALAALQDHQIPADRFALIPNPGADWPTVVGALIDGVNLVAVGVSGPVAEPVARSLQARAREKGCVLVPTSPWPAATVTIEVTGRRWEGLGHGRGRLRRQILQVQASGRGAASRPRSATVAIGAPPVDVAKLIAALPLPDIQTYEAPAPAAPAEHDGVQTEPDLWSNLKPNDEPVGPWAELTPHLPKRERKRR